MSRYHSIKKLYAITLLLCSLFSGIQATISLTYEPGDLEFIFFGKYRPEIFWGDNISLLNSSLRSGCRPLDRILYARHTLDFSADFVYGKKRYDCKAVEFMMTVRNKGVWGNPESIAATTSSDVRFLGALLGSHKHAIPRHIFWMRELWLQMTLGKPIGLAWDQAPILTVGIFPYQLGRGIALGDAYAVGPDLLGFYSDNAIDQYAPGALLTFEPIKEQLIYDLYIAILQNKSGSLGDTGARLFAQEFGRRGCPSRGFGAINFVVANRVKWQVFKNEALGKFTLEPYAMYNHDPEQKVEFIGDANSRLLTLGCAGEYEASCWEFGFDYAVNLGRQKVKGWDRNIIEVQNRNGRATLINSHVLVNASPSAAGAPSSLDPFKAISSDQTITPPPALTVSSVGKNAQSLINNAQQGEEFNGQLLGSIPGYTTNVGGIPNPVQGTVTVDQFFNARNRFRNPYINTYEGWMCVGDAAWWVYKRDLKFALGAGVASGDENPNFETIDGNFTGFIGIQEMYSGKRVRSAFTLGGAGRLRRPLSVPDVEVAPTPFSSEVSGFTNLVFTGAALTWTPTDWEKKFSWMPNVLAYWQEFPTKKFDITTKTNLPQDARTFLGIEVNSFIKYALIKDLTAYFVGSVFVPGGHYADIQGKPLDAAQDRALDAFNNSGQVGPIPNIGRDTAVTLNFGLEYVF